ncbi:MAG: M28 family peptidase [Myxococcota bacterium]
MTKNAVCRNDHTFEHDFFGKTVRCHNFVGRFPGERPGTLLLGTHYDTRPHADCDPRPERRLEPVPGANDGASGVAVLLSLVDWLRDESRRPTVDLTLFDAEDWHQIDGNWVSLGARRFVEANEAELPDAVLVLDMIGAQGLNVQFDLSVRDHPPSMEWGLALHRLARAEGVLPFCRQEETPLTWVQDDHTPFLERGIRSCLMIDMDYPVWHTVDDTLEQCDPAVLDEMARFSRSAIVKLAATFE